MPVEGMGKFVRPFTSEHTAASIAAAQHLSASLMSVVRVLEQTRQQFAESIGVNVTEVRALGRIAEFGPITPKDLAARLALTTGTITPVLDSLSSAGLVERVPNRADRRSVHVQLTDLGEAHMTWVYRDLHARVLRAIAGEDEENAQRLAVFLDEVVTVLAEFTGLPPANKP